MLGSGENTPQPALSHVEPILAVTDVVKTVSYWHEVLGFPGKWTWGEPPSHGGVSWDGAMIQFSLNPDLAVASEGHSLWIRVRNLEALYVLHRENKADIAAPLENKPWGMAEYTVREINGYRVRFAAPVSDRVGSAATLPHTIRVALRRPTAAEFRGLVSAVGWSAYANDAVVDTLLSAVLFAVVAEDTATGGAVGCALLLGDNASFYYVKDVMVHPDWQGKRVGTVLMHELTRWLEANAPDNAVVGLYTGENLVPFYKQFGFSRAFGMHRRIRRNPRDG